MADILIVDDEINIVQLVKRFAEHEGHHIMAASNGLEAVKLCKENNYDIIVMDIMMPDMDGYTACKEILSERDIPIIMLSALGEEYDKLMGFELGIDDYVVKPFSPKELMARIKAVVSRNTKEKKKTDIKLKGIRIDKLGRNVYVDNVKVELTAKEYELLLYFAENEGIAKKKKKIYRRERWNSNTGVR